MAKFEPAFEKTMEFEGVYDNDHDDPGGETVYGLNRRSDPAWPGWIDVDRIPPSNRGRVISKTPAIRKSAMDHYRQTYWRYVHGDTVADQAIAEKYFDCAVNAGIGHAAKWLQTGLNSACEAGLEVDGIDGQKTQAAAAIIRDPAINARILHSIRLQQKAYYMAIVANRPVMCKYLTGWLRRAAS